MEADGFSVDYSALDAAIARTMTQSKRDLPEMLKVTAKRVVQRIIAITPPASITKGRANANWKVALGARAKAQGERKILSNISHIYGTPSGAYDQMKVSGNAYMADAFWSDYKKGELQRAKDLFYQTTGKSFSPFDDGALHLRLGRGARKKAQPYFYTSEPEKLKAYIKKILSRVGWLAAGWNQAAAMLGIQPPQWIWRHPAPGRGVVNITADGVRITMTNAVSYAGDIDDWERRIQDALNDTAEKMNNTSQDYIRDVLKQSGFVVNGSTEWRKAQAA